MYFIVIIILSICYKYITRLKPEHMLCHAFV